MVKKAVLAELLDSFLHGFDGDVRQNDHAGIRNECSPVLCTRLQILLEPDWIVEENRVKTITIHFNQDVTQIATVTGFPCFLLGEFAKEHQFGH